MEIGDHGDVFSGIREGHDTRSTCGCLIIWGRAEQGGYCYRGSVILVVGHDLVQGLSLSHVQIHHAPLLMSDLAWTLGPLCGESASKGEQ